MTFQGIPAEAFGFYERLEADNSRSFWDAHKIDYQKYVRDPAGSRDWPAGPLLQSAEAFGLVHQTWRRLVPLCDWLCEHVGPPQTRHHGHKASDPHSCRQAVPGLNIWAWHLAVRGHHGIPVTRPVPAQRSPRGSGGRRTRQPAGHAQE
jgi:hypothetical protein